MDREGEEAALTSIFFGLSGGLGPIVRNAPAAERFKEQGARVSMSIYGEGSMAWVRRLGYELLVDDDPLMPAEDSLLLPQPTIYNVDHYFAQMGLLDEAFTESWIRHRIQMLEQERPDLVIADMSLHTLLAARALGIPSISMVQSCYHPDGKPMWYWGRAPRNLPRVTPVLNRVLVRLGIAPVQRIEECFRGMWISCQASLSWIESITTPYVMQDRSPIRFIRPFDRIGPGSMSSPFWSIRAGWRTRPACLVGACWRWSCKHLGDSQ